MPILSAAFPVEIEARTDPERLTVVTAELDGI